MKVIIRLSAREEAKALPILLRHSPGMVLPDRTYVISEEAAGLLRAEGVQFNEVSREADAPVSELKTQLKRSFKQEEILIVERDVRTL